MTSYHDGNPWAARVAASVLVSFSIAVGSAALADAQPNNGGGTSDEWDIGVYDSCMKHHPSYGDPEDQLDWAIQCCYSSGGVWGSGGHCQAPPGEASSTPVGPGPQQATPPLGVQAPPSPVNLTAPMHPDRMG